MGDTESLEFGVRGLAGVLTPYASQLHGLWFVETDMRLSWMASLGWLFLHAISSYYPHVCPHGHKYTHMCTHRALETSSLDFDCGG